MKSFIPWIGGKSLLAKKIIEQFPDDVDRFEVFGGGSVLFYNDFNSCLEQVEKRLERVVIENKDFENLIKVYDRPKALFYCDSPYHKTEYFYDAVFTEADHERLKAILSQIKGRFILSYNCTKIMKLFLLNVRTTFHETYRTDNQKFLIYFFRIIINDLVILL